jgi:hypothetical protein
MFQASLVLTVFSAVLFIVSIFIWGAPALCNISIRAPNVESFIRTYFKRLHAERKKNLVLSELANIELFIARMLTCGVYTVHEIIGVAADMSNRLKPYFMRCYNRYFVSTTDAIEQMKAEISDDTFTILCDALIHASSFSKQDMGIQVSEHLEHIKKLRIYTRQRIISHKETKFAFTMILPVGAFMVVQVYPWLIQAVNQLDVIW